ncbi:sarcoplasmic calcium-binding protein-like [Liolophura sinensis]|uniref:sarcoplasmic calcium-binding protein-like n=1 Tax=Liolophura sinensis TaxID=3198878 RepID=UPI00315891D5
MADLQVLQEKWRMWFDSLDVNKSGVLTPKTWTDAADVLISGHSLEGNDAATARAKMGKLGKTVLGDSQSSITKEQFTQNLTTFFEKDQKQALDYITSVLRSLFEVMDTNNDCMVDEAGFVLMCRAFGHGEDTAKVVFKIISGGQDQIDVDVCVKFWTDVWFSADNEKWQNISEALKQ